MATSPPKELPSLTIPSFEQLLGNMDVERILVTAGLIVLGLLAAGFGARITRRLSAKKLSPLQVTLVSRAAFLVIMLITASVALNLWSLRLTVLFGAAGILTLAIGFASQTSASNLIAGIFLMTEGSFSLGDIIQVEGMVGEVVSIDLLSLKLRRFDNILVRIPNEKLIKADVETLTKFPIRRVDLRLNFHYEQNVQEVRALLEEAARKEPRALVEPKPEFIVDSIVDGNVSGRFSAWATQSNFAAVRSSIAEFALETLTSNGVALAGPRRLVEVVNRAGILTSRPDESRDSDNA